MEGGATIRKVISVIPLRQLKFASRRYLEQESWTEDLRKKLEAEGLVLDIRYESVVRA